jgi:hypothetical protein
MYDNTNPPGGEQPIYAGRDQEVVGYCWVDENGCVNVQLTGGWTFKDVDEPVKIKGYNELPEDRPVAGQFVGPGTYKGTETSNICVGVYPYYAIHLDVELCPPQ